MQTPYFPERQQGYQDIIKRSESLAHKNREWFSEAVSSGYMYQWNWFGIPLIQFPQDLIVLQQIILGHRPNVIIETGVARGGSAAFYASLLHLAHLGTSQSFKVISIDVDIRDHTRRALDAFVLNDCINLIERSSIDEETLLLVRQLLEPTDKVMVCLDSNHTQEHVTKELELYSPLVSKDHYLVVFDTAIEFLDPLLSKDRPWSPTDNPYRSVQEFLPTADFVLDEFTTTIGGPTSAPGGYLKRFR